MEKTWKTSFFSACRLQKNSLKTTTYPVFRWLCRSIMRTMLDRAMQFITHFLSDIRRKKRGMIFQVIDCKRQIFAKLPFFAK